jgi:hypothetical protein
MIKIVRCTVICVLQDVCSRVKQVTELFLPCIPSDIAPRGIRVIPSFWAPLCQCAQNKNRIHRLAKSQYM